MTQSFLETREAELIDFACELVAIPSPNPPGGERAVADALTARLRKFGVDDIRVVGRERDRPNVIARVPGTGGGPVLILNGHTDTRPPGDLTAWQTDPYTPVISGGRLYGLGAVDMKGALAAIAYTAGALAVAPPRGDLVAVFTADEEAGAFFGAQYLAEQRLLRADAAVIAEPAGVRSDWEAIRLVSRGNALFRIRVHGRPLHSGLSGEVASVSANLGAARLIAAMERLGADLFRHTPHPLAPHAPTLNPALKMEGGFGYGVIAEEAEVLCDVRCPPGMTREGIEADLAAFLASARRDDPTLDADCTIEFWLRPCAVDPDHPVVAALQAASAEVLGASPPLAAFPASTDAPFFALDSGIPTVPAYGPGLLTEAHRPNESVPVAGIVEAAQIYTAAARRFLDGEG